MIIGIDGDLAGREAVDSRQSSSPQKAMVAALSSWPRSVGLIGSQKRTRALRPGHGSLRQGLAIARDLAGRGEPQIVLARHDVAPRPAQRTQPEWLDDDDREQPDAQHQWVFPRLLQHHVELD